VITPELSIVVPVYNEVESLPVLWEELVAALRAVALPAEVIFVDDGSTDCSAEVVRRIHETDPRARLVRLARNAGLSAAFAAGFRHARGRIVVTMDADLQNDPADIPALLAYLDAWDAACGWRQVRHDPWVKRVSSRIANQVRRWVLGDDVRDSACSLRAMHRRCLAGVEPFHGFHRFLPTLLRQAGHRVIEVPVRHRPRRYGISHYGVRNRAWRAFVDLLGVRWMASRRLHYEVCEDGAPAASDEGARGCRRYAVALVTSAPLSAAAGPGPCSTRPGRRSDTTPA
jgi:glycosyltransferase involved in cell wall biosynthesis